jgi:hypothetical protein
MNRSAAVKIPVLVDEELVRLLSEVIRSAPRGKSFDLLNTLSLLTRVRENHPIYIKYGIVQLFTDMLKGKNFMKSVYLSVVEALCYLSDDLECKTIIIQVRFFCFCYLFVFIFILFFFLKYFFF